MRRLTLIAMIGLFTVGLLTACGPKQYDQDDVPPITTGDSNELDPAAEGGE